MNTKDFFGHPDVVLPRERGNDDFYEYLDGLFASYQAQIKSLNAVRPLPATIRAALPDVLRLSGWILDAVRHYLSGSPAAAYGQMKQGIDFVSSRMTELYSVKRNWSRLPIHR